MLHLSKRDIIARQTQRNLSFRRSKQQNTLPIKLPNVINRKLSKTKPNDLSHSKITTALIIKQYSPRDHFQPVASTAHLAVIKDHIMKENLSQKTTLKCKSPRIGSAFSRSTIYNGNEEYEPTRSSRPLQGMDVGSLLSEIARTRLNHLFNTLDTDRDGHLFYPQVQKCLPANFPHAQMTFFRVLYDVISGTTYFGLQEFYAIAIIVEIIGKQDPMLWKTYLDDVDFNYYHDDVLELLEEFNNQCLSKREYIIYENLLEIILKRRNNEKIERIATELQYVIPNIKILKINRLDFLALLPSIIYIESCLDHGQILFRFRENSLLDQHMQLVL
ncbi:hypothetical protein I4U23_001040 [Adineta vaga]|nr:hypothetical protein I4U23_001040 [Adineta vaga]